MPNPTIEEVGECSKSLTPVSSPQTCTESDKDFNINDHSIQVRVLPEKKGLIIKHSEYEILAKQYGKQKVQRRYKDFVSLYNYLVEKYPYRMIPNLPPKQLMIDSLLEERRQGLQNWLTIVSLHPVIGSSPLLVNFITDTTSEYQFRLKVEYEKTLTEFNRLQADTELPDEDQGKVAASREMMKSVLFAIQKLKKIFDLQAHRAQEQAKDMTEVSSLLKQLHTKNICETKIYLDVALGSLDTASASENYAKLQQNAICERLHLLLEVLEAHDSLCDRVERGILSEYQRALSKMVHLNKQKMKTVIRGADAENVNNIQQHEMAQNNELVELNRETNFSLRCILRETALVQKYLLSLPSILLSFANEEGELHSKIAEVWHQIILNESTELN